MLRKRIVTLGLAIATLLTLSACQENAAQSAQQAPATAGVAVQVRPVSLETISTQNKVSGKVVAENERSLFVATNAKCTAVYVQAGDQVQAGDKICTLDLGSTLSSYSAAKISYAAAAESYQSQGAILDAQIALYEKNMSDLKALLEIGAAAQLELDTAQLTLDSAKAQRASALSQLEAGMQSYKSNVEQLSTVLENVDATGNIIAPISGTLVSLTATQGGFVSPSLPVAVIDGAEQMKIVVAVSEALVPKLIIGAEATVSVSSKEESFVGTIRAVEQTASPQTKLYSVTLAVPAQVGGLLSGMFADVTFHTDTTEHAIVIPSDAILNSGAVQYVYVIEGDVAKYTPVQTGATGNGVTQILVGLTQGQQLVTVGQAYLSDGEPVRLVSGEG